MAFIWLGALLIIGGLLYLVKQAIWRGPPSGHVRRRRLGDPTIELQSPPKGGGERPIRLLRCARPKRS